MERREMYTYTKLKLDENGRSYENAALDKYYPKRRGYPSSIQELLNSWAYFVECLRNGRHGSEFEYKNYLGLRRVIGRIIDEAPNYLRDQLTEIVSKIDECFVEETRWSQQASQESHFLDNMARIPKRFDPNGEFAIFLREQGHI